MLWNQSLDAGFCFSFRNVTHPRILQLAATVVSCMRITPSLPRPLWRWRFFFNPKIQSSQVNPKKNNKNRELLMSTLKDLHRGHLRFSDTFNLHTSKDYDHRYSKRLFNFGCLLGKYSEDVSPKIPAMYRHRHPGTLECASRALRLWEKIHGWRWVHRWVGWHQGGFKKTW